MRILLHGGNSSNVSDANRAFFRDIVEGIKKPAVNILCVYFARPPHRWEESYHEDQSIFRNLETNVEINTVLATDNKDDFLQKLTEADVLFINGGRKGNLKDFLLSIGRYEFRKCLEGKTLVGISAGANVLCKYYYSSVADEVREGAGFIDIKLFTHYTPDQAERLSTLAQYDPRLPMYTIVEEEYEVFE